MQRLHHTVHDILMTAVLSAVVVMLAGQVVRSAWHGWITPGATAVLATIIAVMAAGVVAGWHVSGRRNRQ